MIRQPAERLTITEDMMCRVVVGSPGRHGSLQDPAASERASAHQRRCAVLCAHRSPFIVDDHPPHDANSCSRLACLVNLTADGLNHGWTDDFNSFDRHRTPAATDQATLKTDTRCLLVYLPCYIRCMKWPRATTDPAPSEQSLSKLWA